MRIVFITYFYPPKQYPRSIQISRLVQHFRKNFAIDVITPSLENKGDPSLLEFIPLDNVIYSPKSALTNVVEYCRGDRLKKAVLPDFYYFSHFDLYKTALEHINKTDATIVVTFGQPMSTHLVGLKLKKKFPHLKWISHFSDPWVDNKFNEYNVWTRYINKFYQDKVFEHSDQLVFTSQETINLVMRPYPEKVSAKAKCLVHFFNDSLYPSHNAKQEFFIIRYLGNFYGDRQPSAFLEALQILKKNRILSEKIKIEFIGGSNTTEIEKKLQEYDLSDRVIVRSAVNYLESLRLMKESDLLLLIDAPAETSPFLPSKLIDYIGADKPIFGITPQGTAQKLIEEMGYLVANPNNPQEIADNLMQSIAKVQGGQINGIARVIRDRYSIDNCVPFFI